MTTQTNPIVAENATERSALDLNKPSLIGIVGTAENRRVLIRHPRGKIETLTLGDTLAPGTIIAISEDAVMISTPLGSRKLTLPKPTAARRAA